MTSSFVVGGCHKYRKSQPVHDLVLCVNTIGVLDHTYPELSVARATFFVFNLATFGASFALFIPFGTIFRSVPGPKNIFGTYICSQSTLVLEVQSYLFVFTSTKLWAFFALFGPLGTIFSVKVRFKNIIGTYLHRLTTFVLEV